MSKKINVLIVEDSLTAQLLLKSILSADDEIDVIGTATDGQAALDLIAKLRPDVVTMDLHMPGMDGLEATRRIMETKPLPIVIVSSMWSPRNKVEAFNYIAAGAVAALEKPLSIGEPGYEECCQQLVRTVKLMSEIKVVRRLSASLPRSERIIEGAAADLGTVKIIAIGASTGGPPVLRTILSNISSDLPVPILIVQHIARGFLPGLAEWLNATSRLPISIARNGEAVLPGHVYLAPDAFELGVSRPKRMFLSPGRAVHVPSASFLFRSLAMNFGPEAIGVLLTGMGADGALELALMKQKGATTIAQDKASCVVFGMPGEAIKLGGATFVLPPNKIAPAIESVVSARKRKAGRVTE